MVDAISYDELYYLVSEKNEAAEDMLFREVERFLGWISFSESNDFLREEDIFSFGWQGYIEAFKGYDEHNTTTFKSFLQHCIRRRLIDVQRNRNKRTMKGLMSGLLMSEDKVHYAVEVRQTTKVDTTRLAFQAFWEALTKEEEQLFIKQLGGENVTELSAFFEVTESVMYKRLQALKRKLEKHLQDLSI